MSKRIIVCCDGTGQKFEENKSNPLRFHYCLKNTPDQVSFYDPGVGTFDPDGKDYSGGWIESIVSSISKKVCGGGLGYGIVQNIRDAYAYLMNVYEQGDNVFLIGFSRGAFTAQAVAGLLNKCGLLYPNNDNLLPYALQIYLRKGNPRIAREFKKTMAREVKPEMLGVWDTVKSLGNNHEDDFFYRDVSENSRYGYHALSIDEQREDFMPSLWGERGGENHMEVWFPGVHADVGGGYPEDGLANGALKWMIECAEYHGVGFQKDRVSEFPPNPTGKMHESCTGFWELRGAEKRIIPEGANIHESAITRMQADIGYKPENLPGKYNRICSL